MLYDQDFLKQLMLSKNRIMYARITTLHLNGSPIEALEGRVTGGSINIDGASSVRRSCSLTLIAKEVNINDYYWGLNSRFKLEIGLHNTIDERYPEIIWFPQGHYIISQFSCSLSTSNYTINISGKDKMCLLNGTVGGSLASAVDFGTIEEIDKKGNLTIRKQAIQDIIRESVHTYANEPFHNIIINDLDTIGLELLEYRYDEPLFLLRANYEDTYFNGTFDKEIVCQVLPYETILNQGETIAEAARRMMNILPAVAGDYLIIKEAVGIGDYIDRAYFYYSGANWSQVSQITEHRFIKLGEIPSYDLLVNTLADLDIPTKFTMAPHNLSPDLCAAKIEWGQTAGYRTTPLTYAGDLLANAGDSLTSIYNKIVQMLGDFEYFYDLDGRFVFQRKPIYINTTWTPIEEDGDGLPYVDWTESASREVYEFIDNELIISLNNSPNLNNVKNDFSAWGARTSAGSKIPVHMRYAIDKKPTSYHSITVSDAELEEYNKKYSLDVKGQVGKLYSTTQYDWREIIYHMALDFVKFNHLDSFVSKLIDANGDVYPEGKTGYEDYYIDLQAFWRDLYYPAEALTEDLARYDRRIEAQQTLMNAEPNPDYKPLYEAEIERLTNEKDRLSSNHIANYYQKGHIKYPWNKNIYEAPELLNFWLDFLDIEGELSQFSCQVIGHRPKVVNNDAIKAIYFRETPMIVFSTADKWDQERKEGYRQFLVENDVKMEEMFSISTQGKSAKTEIDELLYNYAYCAETVSLTTIPIYCLDVNNRIYIYDKDSGVDGSYIVEKISIPLTYNGNSSITATKVAERLL